MTQRGIDLGTLDTAYLSSLSWYLIVLYGIRSFMMVITGGQTSKKTVCFCFLRGVFDSKGYRTIACCLISR